MMYSLSETLLRKTARLHWPLLILVTLLCVMGFVLLYDASGGSFAPYANKQMARFGAGMGIIWFLAVVNIRFIYKYAYAFYAMTLVMLALVPFVGITGMGAKRWLNLGFINVQPSELAKIALVLALARFFHSKPTNALHSIPSMGTLVFLIGAPALLTMQQPDLGTAIILVAIGAGMMLAGGMALRIFAFAVFATTAAAPVLWSFLKTYQKERILTFLNPERDPLGAGYHIIQSKIAIGSAGFWGKGFMQGTQSHLQFLPEKHTDFIFTLLVEDFGMAGALAMIVCFGLLLLTGIVISLRTHSLFSSMVASGIMLVIFFHAFINIAMVMGLMPVVGVPLPLISYGGTSLLTMLIGIGFVMNAYVHRDVVLPTATGIRGSSRF